MINSRVALLFKNLPDKYPKMLARDYTHVLNHLMQLWNTPKFDAYMHDLMIDHRGGRQGFSLKVVEELLFLSKLHDVCKKNGYELPRFEDPWESIPFANPTPQGFMQAIERGQQHAIEIFLGAGVRIDYRFEGGQTPLMIAAINAQLGVVRYLIHNGAEVNAADTGKYTALHWAAFYNHTQIAGELCIAGALIDAVQNSGGTPLSLAVTRGHLAAAKLLLECQANPNIAGTHGSLLAIAQKRNSHELLVLLRQYGARP
jgi:hypothetical protein